MRGPLRSTDWVGVLTASKYLGPPGSLRATLASIGESDPLHLMGCLRWRGLETAAVSNQRCPPIIVARRWDLGHNQSPLTGFVGAYLSLSRKLAVICVLLLRRTSRSRCGGHAASSSLLAQLSSCGPLRIFVYLFIIGE